MGGKMRLQAVTRLKASSTASSKRAPQLLSMTQPMQLHHTYH
jgi:hypothetical protein